MVPDVVCWVLMLATMWCSHAQEVLLEWSEVDEVLDDEGVSWSAFRRLLV